MRASDVMTPYVITVTPDTTIHMAARLLADNHISGLPVVDEDDAVIGVVTEGDLLHRAEICTGSPRRAWWLELLSSTRDLAHEYAKEHARTVKDVMSSNVIAVSDDAPLSQIADLLGRHGIKRVPVLKAGKLVGIVSRANLIRALASTTPPQKSHGVPDDRAIRDAVLTELHGRRWALPRQNVIVSEGTVHLWGVIESEEESCAIRAAAESVQGVKRVESHLEYPPIIPAL